MAWVVRRPGWPSGGGLQPVDLTGVLFTKIRAQPRYRPPYTLLVACESQWNGYGTPSITDPLLLGPLRARAFNIVIAGRAAGTPTHVSHSGIRRLPAVSLRDRVKVGRGNLYAHVERAGP